MGQRTLRQQHQNQAERKHGWLRFLKQICTRWLMWQRVLRPHSAMRSASLYAENWRPPVVAQLLIDLEVAKSHSRPYISDDNPFSESNFKTLKYRPEFPDRFGCIEGTRAHCQQFFG